MAPVHVAALLSHPAVRSAIERALAARGVHGDTSIIHVDPREEAMLRMMGGVGTVNPRTGLRQFYPGQGGAGGMGSDTGGQAGSDPGGLGHGTGTGNQGWGGPDRGGILGDVGRAIGAVGSALGQGVGSVLGGGLFGSGGFLSRAAGNFGQGWASQGVRGGYGGAGNQSGAGYGGRGGGLSGGHSGESGRPGGAGGYPYPTTTGGYQQAPLPQAPVINNMPAPVPVTLDPMMSDTATTNLIGDRFGVLPSWATTPEQIGTAPSSYPTSGVNAGIGAPGYAGNPLPGQPGGGGILGGGGAPGGGGGAPGGGGGVPGGGGAPGGQPIIIQTPHGPATMAQLIQATGGAYTPTQLLAAAKAGQSFQPITHATPGFAAMPQKWTALPARTGGKNFG